MTKRVVALVGILATALILLVFGVFLFVLRGMAHRYYEVEGAIRINGAKPNYVTLPAVACQWWTRSDHGHAYAHTVNGPTGVDGTAYVVCEIPAGGASIPFKTSTYANVGHGIQLGAYLRPIPMSHPACGDDRGPVVRVVDEGLELDRVCSHQPLPPDSEMALAAPFGGGITRASRTLRFVVARAE